MPNRLPLTRVQALTQAVDPGVRALAFEVLYYRRVTAGCECPHGILLTRRCRDCGALEKRDRGEGKTA